MPPRSAALPTSLPPGPAPSEGHRAEVRGRFLYVGDRKLYLRGITYGTFRPRADGSQFPEPEVVAADFAGMAAAGINSVRTYTPAPWWLLDLAVEHGLFVVAGLPWEGHITFLDSRTTRRSIEARVREGVRGMAGHPALLAYTIGNEVPGGIARWHGRRPMERFIECLYRAARDEDPDALTTYVNFPTTEYLQLPFVDFVSFNVYLEHQADLASYLARLHNLAGERPLVMAEIGLDSRRNGEDVQATVLEWQIGTAFQSGCAGAFVFAWTDEWHRGGHDIEDWDFGIVDRQRRPKQALGAVGQAFERLHHDPAVDWPPMSVIICSYNGERWLPGCLQALRGVDYPDFEVIVVSDGSTDRTAQLAREAGVRVVDSEENRGLSHARNLGMQTATGDVVVYLDDDARPDPDWLRYLGLAFARSPHVAIGGPNIAPEGDGDVATSVANSPGGPVHVLVSDELAEHLPGCNLAIRRDALAAIEGFDTRFRIAGDDVDVCWRLQDAGGTIGYSPGAMVWHHRRGSVRAYLRQQHLYGRAEGLLEGKWPERYNRFGHLSWAGRIYGAGARMLQPGRAKVGYGTWGTALFQSIYEPAPGPLRFMAVMPEWYLLLAGLAGLSALGALWSPLLLALPLLIAATVAMVVRAHSAAGRHQLGPDRVASRPRRIRLRLLTTVLHMLQPLVRLAGRLRQGLSPWRRRSRRRLAWPWTQTVSVWSEGWADGEEWLRRVDSWLRPECEAVTHGAEHDRWDLQVRGGALGVARVLSVVEEHGDGRQMIRFRVWPVPSRALSVVAVPLAALAFLAGSDGALAAAIILALLATAVVGVGLYDCALAAGSLCFALGELDRHVHGGNATFTAQSAERAELAARIGDVDDVEGSAPPAASHAVSPSAGANGADHAEPERRNVA
jgi:GT2 family glycosyltransferase